MNPPVQRLLLGEWGRVVRDPIDVLRLHFLLGAAVIGASGDVSNALRLLLAFGAVGVARFVNVPRPFDLGFVVSLAISVWGGPLGLFEELPWYDELLHGVFSFFGAPLLYILLIRLEVVPDLESEEPQRHRYAGILLGTFALGFSIGSLFEIWEWLANNWLGATNIIGYQDTIADLAEDAVASLGGGGLLLLWAEYGWGTVRRLPGER